MAAFGAFRHRRVPPLSDISTDSTDALIKARAFLPLASPHSAGAFIVPSSSIYFTFPGGGSSRLSEGTRSPLALVGLSSDWSEGGDSPFRSGISDSISPRQHKPFPVASLLRLVL